MTNQELLDILGSVKGEYILQAQALRSGETKAGTRKFSGKRAVLIAAAVSLLLLLVGCAAYALHWYTTFFTMRREEPLSDSQVAYIQDHVQDFHESQTYDGYTISLVSAMAEENAAFVTFRLTAPEDVDLGFAFGDEKLYFEYYFAGPADSKLPTGAALSVVEDGDGKSNTVYIVLNINPVGIQVYEGVDTAFGKGHPWRIVFKNPEKIGYDREYEEKLLQTKFPGQTEYFFDGEDAAKIHPHTRLAEGRWEFIVEIESPDTEFLELLSAPISTKALVSRKDQVEEMFFETQDAIETIFVTSIRLHSFGATVTFTPPETLAGTPFPHYFCAWLDMGDMYNPLTKLVRGDENFFVVLKDGTRIDFWQSVGAVDIAELEADSPIVLDEVDYLQLSDGTVLYTQR